MSLPRKAPSYHRPKRPALRERNDHIRQRYRELYAKGLRVEIVAERVAKEFYLSASYVLRVVGME